MNTDELKKRKEELEAKLKWAEAFHNKYGQGISNEEDYRASWQTICRIYNELASVCDKLGEPIHIRI